MKQQENKGMARELTGEENPSAYARDGAGDWTEDITTDAGSPAESGTGKLNRPAVAESDRKEYPTSNEGGRTELTTGQRERYRSPFWVDLLAIIGVFIVASITGGLVGGLVKTTAGAEQAFVTFLANAIALGVTFFFALYMKFRRGQRRPLLRFSLKRSNPALILWGLILVCATSVALEPLLDLFPEVNMQVLKTTIGTGGWAIMSVVVLAPVMEELIFRGIIQEWAGSVLGPLRGVLLASAVFGIVHIIPQQVINAFFVGIILGYIYIRTGSLLPVIMIHAVNNALAYISMMMFDGQSGVSTRELINDPVWYWIVYGVCIVFVIVAGFNLWARLEKSGRRAEHGTV